MIRRAVLACLSAALLSGCLAAPAPNAPSLLRNPTVPLSIISRGGAEAMQGEWTVRTSAPGYRDVTAVTFNTHRGARPSVLFHSGSAIEGWLAEPLAQNRWRLTSETTDTDKELWVIWIDDGFRTAAIGSPDSDMAFVLDRKASGGADRITAATEVLDFNGYNTSAFVPR